MLQKILCGIAVLSGAGLAVVLNTTNPNTSGPMLILLVFLLAYFFIMPALAIVIFWSHTFFVFLSKVLFDGNALSKMTFRSSYYQASVVAFAPLILVGLQSVGGLNLYSIILVGFFLFLGCFYVSKQAH